MEEIAPQTPPGTQAELLLAGTTYSVDLKTTDKAGNLRIDLIGHGEVFETEDYEYDPHSFSVEEAAEEQYAPPLPLLTFPIRTEDPVSWSGTLTSGHIGRQATATVTTTTERSYLGGAGEDTLKVNVVLNMVADPNHPPLSRQLVFWFARGRGLVKREFGTTSVRQPPNAQ
jgi:hypothetical protein